jgi:hypothetical protein
MIDEPRRNAIIERIQLSCIKSPFKLNYYIVIRTVRYICIISR